MQLNDQKGSILVYSLLLLVFMIAICLAMQNSAILEYKMSLYEHRSNQARELAEAAAWMTLEEINEILLADFIYEKELPRQISLADDYMVLAGEMNTNISKIQLEQQTLDYCIYSYSSQGSYKGAQKNLFVEVQICFDEYYVIIPDQPMIFVFREFTDRGRFVSFEEIKET
ncbi:MAG: hypothetical protein GX581_03010 [Syntrophomonadaceae bacterium]|jgi:hypothetical protein|nr:hypothetical protein [Syntrophomonadaceae bacterium]